MLKWLKGNERGSIEVVILVLVFAVAIGLVVWRVAETQNAQTDAERSAAIADNAPDVTTKYVTVEELGFKFVSPHDAGELTYQINGKAGEEYVRIFSAVLKEAKYTCEDENTGEIGTIHVIQKGEPSDNITKPKYTKTIGDKEYGFYTALQNVCYEDGVQKKFAETVPQAMIEGIQQVK